MRNYDWLARIKRDYEMRQYLRAKQLRSLTNTLLASAAIRSTAFMLPRARELKVIEGRRFKALPGHNAVVAIPYKLARKNFKLTRGEYNALIGREKELVKEAPLVWFAKIGAPTATATGGIHAADEILWTPAYKSILPSLLASRFLVRNPLLALAERNADIAAAKKYGIHYLNALRKAKKYGKRTPFDNIVFFNPRTSIENRIRRIKPYVKVPVVPPALAIGAAGGLAAGAYLGSRKKSKRRKRNGF